LRHLTRPEQIWLLSGPTRAELREGADYALKSMPWTFNRMMYNTSSNGQQTRALNIAKGVVGQRMLHRELKRRGAKSELQVKSYREKDLFDSRVKVGGTQRHLDFKTFNYYTNYAGDERESLSSEFILQNRDYPGPDWRRFFPMLVPHTQIRQPKELYCFAVAASIDFRRDIETDRSIQNLAAFPHGDGLPFFSSRRLCLKREEEDRGFFVKVAYDTRGTLSNDHPVHFKINGEREGRFTSEEAVLRAGKESREVGPFSCICSFQVDHEDLGDFYGKARISVSRNDYRSPMRNSSGKDVNVVPRKDLLITRGDFCNLILPESYALYILGWTAKADYLQACRKYTGWVWPNDKVNRFANQPWSQVTEEDKETLEAAGFADCIQTKPKLARAGFMKTTGRGNGACCYFYPNIYGVGGLKETNLYVLPQDLCAMDELADMGAER